MNPYKREQGERSRLDLVPEQSARGLAQSKTLTRGLERWWPRQCLGVRWQAAHLSR